MLKLPEDFLNKYRKLLGNEKATEFFLAMEKPAKKAFRINSLKKENKVSYLKSKTVPGIPNAFYDEVYGQSPEWCSGTVYSQDPAAMFPAIIADLQPGECVLDLCAAPGGKSTSLGEQLQGKGILVANEISYSRAKALRENIERWGITNAIITNESPEKLSSQFLHFFDKILVDAPCSGEGMFRKNPEAAGYWSQDYVQLCQTRQKKILTEAVKMLKPGGELVYSTCTFTPEENEQVVSWLVDKFDFVILPIKLNNVPVDFGHPEWANGQTFLQRCLRFWPFDGLGEGQFVAKLKLPTKLNQAKTGKKQKCLKGKIQANLTRDETTLVATVLQKFNLPQSLQDWSQKSRVSQGHVFIPAVTGKDFHFRILNNGVELGILKKNRFEPSHQLAMVLSQVDQQCVVDLNNEDFASFLHGETVQVQTELRGFILVSCRQLIFSFGKVTGNGILKNYYPKGLRTLKKD